MTASTGTHRTTIAHLCAGLVVAAVMVGILLAYAPWAAAGVIALAGALVVPPAWLVIALLAGPWPLIALGEGRAGIAIGVLGILLWISMASTTAVRGIRPRSGARWPLVAVAILLVYTLALSVLGGGFTEGTVRRLGIFVFVSVPMFLFGRAHGDGPMLRRIIAGSSILLLPLVALHAIGIVQLAELPINRISLGVGAAVVGAWAWLDRRVPRSLAAVVFAIAGYSFVANPSLGPKLAAMGVAVLLLGLRRYQDKNSEPSTLLSRRAMRLLGVLLALFVVVDSGNSLLEADQRNPYQRRNIETRIEAFESGLTEASALGLGADAFAEQRIVARAGYPHNVFVDAYFSGGLLGLAVMLLLIAAAVWHGIRTYGLWSFPLLMYIAISMSSGGLYENWYLWLAIGVMTPAAPRQVEGPGEEAETLVRAGPG